MTRFATAALTLMAATTPVFAQGFCPHFGFVHAMPFGVPVAPWGWGPVWAPPVIVVAPPPVVTFAPPRWELDLADFRAPEDPKLATVRVDAAVKRGDLLVVDPKGNGIKLAGGVRPAQPNDVPVLPRPKLPPLPPNDPTERSMYFVNRAKEAFAAGELGLATERLTAAIAAQPKAALPHFLLVQVNASRGRYADAIASLRDGLRLDTNWPTRPFKIADFYGVNADRLRADLAELELAWVANPNDPGLQFLSGYFQWFNGERAEATKRFTKAAAMVKDAEVIELFIRVTK